jgi:hypothetical protein
MGKNLPKGDQGTTLGRPNEPMSRIPFNSIVEAPVAPPRTVEPLDPQLRSELLTDVEERGQVTVHCSIITEWADMIRIWPSTYLVCCHSGHRSRLLHAEGISYAPHWQPIPPGKSIAFTLLFEGLPKDCILFDLVEDIPDQCGFYSPSILRNAVDVYRVEV